MMSVIAGKGRWPYWPGMAATVLRLFALVALMLMPLGMTGAPAMAQPVAADHHGMATNHCGDQPDEDNAPLSKMDCAAMCTALPASDTPVSVPVLKPVAPRSLLVASPFAGIEPEIATPPPRHG